METTTQRTSRINDDDSAAGRERRHAKDFFNGLALYEITPCNTGFYVFEKTPSGQVCSSAKTLEEANEIIEKWKLAAINSGFRKESFE